MLFHNHNSSSRYIETNMRLTTNFNTFSIYYFFINNFKLFTNILSFTKIKNIFMITKSFHYRCTMSKILKYSSSYNRHIITFFKVFDILLWVKSTFILKFIVTLNIKIIINIKTNKHLVMFIISRHSISLIPFLTNLIINVNFIIRKLYNDTICISTNNMYSSKFKRFTKSHCH